MSYVFIAVIFLFNNFCFSQNEIDQYLKLKEIADPFRTYTITIKDSEIAKYFSSRELRNVFDETFSFLKKKKWPVSKAVKNLNMNVIFDGLQVYQPASQLISGPSPFNGLTKYNVITKYSMTIRLEIDAGMDSVLSIPLCTNKYFNKEKEVSVAGPNSLLGRSGTVETSITEAISFRWKSYQPNAGDFKANFLEVLDHYRRRINIQ